MHWNLDSSALYGLDEFLFSDSVTQFYILVEQYLPSNASLYIFCIGTELAVRKTKSGAEFVMNIPSVVESS